MSRMMDKEDDRIYKYWWFIYLIANTGQPQSSNTNTASISLTPRTGFACSSCHGLFGAVLHTVMHTIWPQSYDILASPLNLDFGSIDSHILLLTMNFLSVTVLISFLSLWQNTWDNLLITRGKVRRFEGFHLWSFGPAAGQCILVGVGDRSCCDTDRGRGEARVSISP